MDGKVLEELEALSDVTLQMEVEVLNDVDPGHLRLCLMKSAEEPMASFFTTDVEGVEKRDHLRKAIASRSRWW